MTTEPDIRDIRRKALEAIRRLESKSGKKTKPKPEASPELWPGEHMDLGGFTLAQLKRQLRERFA